MPLNVELLKRVRDHILEEPKRLEMGWWMKKNVNTPDAPPCGTVACIAGWTCTLANNSTDNPKQGYWRTALELLGIKEGLCEELFFTDKWPEDLELQYNEITEDDPKSKQKIAQITAEVINRFIKEHKND